MPNILKNIKITSAYKKPDVIITGLQILDNISRSKEGQDLLKDNNGINAISDILDFFQDNDEILRIGSKIYSKISKPEDIIFLIDLIKEIEYKNDYSDLKELEKALVLISNFILVDDIANLLTLPENSVVLKKIFETISNLDLKNKSKEYNENYIFLNKYFMILFQRLCNIDPNLFEDEKIKANINKNVLNNYQAVCEVKKQNFISSGNSNFNQAFIDYFSSFVDLFEKNYKNKSPEEDLIISIINIIKNEKSFLEEEKPNHSASRVIKIAGKIKTEKVTKIIEELFDFMISSIKNSENIETISNLFEILAENLSIKYSENDLKDFTVDKNGSYLLRGSPLDQVRMKTLSDYITKRDLLIDVSTKFMNEKPKLRKPVIIHF